MHRRTKIMALVLVTTMALSVGAPNQVMAYVLNRDEIEVKIDSDDVIQDQMLNWVIRTAKNKTADRSYAKLTKEDLENNLPEIYYSESDHYDLYEFNVFVKSIEGLQYATNTERILLPYNHISDLTPLTNLTKLTKIVMNDNPISDLTPLSNLTNLTILRLGDNKITDIKPLAKLTNLESLNLELNKGISDISVIKNFSKLVYLNLGNDNISDITPLKDLTNLQDGLLLGNNKIEDISCLANMSKLKELDISSNNVSDISALKNLRNLKILRLSNNKNINDIAPLTNLTKLDKNELWLTDTGIEDKKDDLFKVIDVNKLINKFRANEITLGDKEYVDAARNAYNALSPELQKYIPEIRITAAEENIDRLKKDEPVKYYSELSEFDKQPLELADFKTFKIKVEDKNGQPLPGVKFNLQTKYGSPIKELISDENGNVTHQIAKHEKYMDYQVVLADKDKYTSDFEKHTFKTDGEPNISEINGHPNTGLENIKVVLAAKDTDATAKVDKASLQEAINKAQSKDANIYTEDSYKNLTGTLEVAKATLAKKDATQVEVNISAKNLEDAIANLVAKDTEPEVVNSNTLQIKAIDEKGNPVEGVKFNINDQNNEAMASMTSDANGIAKYNITKNMTYMDFTVDVADKEKYTPKTEKISFEVGTNPEITKINKKAFTGKENLQFVVVPNNEEDIVKVDKTSLEEAINEANNKDTSKYTEDSYKALTSALEVAKATLGKEDATQEEVDTSVKELKEAITNLVVKDTTPEVVESNTLQIKAVDEKGNPVAGVKFNINDQDNQPFASMISDENGIARYSITKNMTYMDFTVNVADTEKYTPKTEKISFEVGEKPEITKINKKDFTGKENLEFVVMPNDKEDTVTKVDKTSLEKAINKVQDKDQSKYTEDSYKNLADALELARTTLSKEDATQEEVNTRAKNLEDAITNLVEKTVKPEEKPDVTPEEKPDVAPDVKPEEKPDVKPDVAPDVKPEEKPDIKPGEDLNVIPEEKPSTKPEVKPEINSQVKAETKELSAVTSENKNKGDEKISSLPKTGKTSEVMSILLGSVLTALGAIMLMFKKRN